MKAHTTIGAILSLLILPTTAIANMAPEPELTEERVRELVAEYISQHPQEIMESVARFQREAAFEKFSRAAAPYLDELAGRKRGLPEMGNPDGKITVMEFYDYRCGFCRHHYEVMKELVNRNPDIRWLLLPMPILDRTGEAQVSRYAASMALAANRQGKFREFHDALFAGDGGPVRSEADVDDLARSIVPSIDKLKETAAGDDIARELDFLKEVETDIGIWEAGTPAYIINGKVIVGAQGPEIMMKMIEEARSSSAISR